MMLTRTRNVMVICSVVALCAALVGCSSSDDGRVADLEEQLNMRADITPADLAALRAQVETLTGRADISPQDLATLRAQVETLMGRADISPEDLVDLQKQLDTAEQAVDDMRSAAVTNVIEKIAAPGQPHRCALDTGCASDSGVDYSSVSITHDIGYREHGERLIHAIPWRGDDGQVEFMVRIQPEPLHRRGMDFYFITDINTTARSGDIEDYTTSHSPIEDHGLGSEWQGFEAMKAYNDGGTLTVRFFTDLEDADNPLRPYTNYNAALSEDEILLNDDRIPDLTGRDHLYFPMPEGGLKGSLDGVAGTFTCPEGYCSFLTSWEGPEYVPWEDSAPVLFTPDGAGPARFVRPTRLLSPSAEIAKVNYLSLGSWLYVPEAGADPDDFRFGIFAGGDDAFVGANLPALVGTARYAGKATGMYAEKLEIDTFSADVGFIAEFGSASESGAITGSVSNFALGSGRPSPLSELLLVASDFDDGPGDTNIAPGWPGDDGSISGGFVGGPAHSNDGWQGGWDAKFYGNDATDSTAHPTSFAGAFGATDGDRHIAGSFGAYKQ